MSEILQDRSRVVPFVREFVAGRVPEHVRVDREVGKGSFASSPASSVRRARLRTNTVTLDNRAGARATRAAPAHESAG
jgi:hypothetical protein